MTKEELKAYKSLEGYKYIAAGWVGSVHAYAALADSSKVIATVYVRHSQSIPQAKIRPWVAAEQSGTIICAHYTCMAGLGETCSYIAICLALCCRNSHSFSKNTACTSLPCGWLPPTLKNVTYNLQTC